MDEQANSAIHPADQEADLICEALVREMGRNTRWKAKVEAWQALLNVRMQQDAMSAEQRHLAGSATGSGITGPARGSVLGRVG